MAKQPSPDVVTAASIRSTGLTLLPRPLSSRWDAEDTVTFVVQFSKAALHKTKRGRTGMRQHVSAAKAVASWSELPF
jgi:hypothetical protein